MDWGMPGSAELWRGALAGLPIALACGALCRLVPLRPAARHTLWVAALLGFLVPALISPATAARVAGTLRDALPVAHIQSGLSNAAEFAGGTFEKCYRSLSQIFGDQQNCVSPGAADAPIAASSPRGDDPAAKEPAQEAEPSSTPRIVLQSPASENQHVRDAAQKKRHRPRESANRATPWLKDVPSVNPPPPIYVDAAKKSKTTEPASIGELASANDSVKSAMERSGPGIATVEVNAADAGAGRAIETTAAISPATPIAPAADLVEEPNALTTWFAAASLLILNTTRKIAELPAIPTSLWVGGLIALALWQVFRTWSFWRRVRKALPAPSVIRRAVDLAAKDMGLARSPRTFLVDARVSPLIWCLRKPVLILPQRLWAQLDKKGRHAILCHELAHLRRRDHWIAWIEQIVALLYWWNPLVWWIRKRIHDEADLACDAWVTWLMPENRRSYAEALLQTRQFTSSGRWITPTAGMAAASGRASDFSRRLTMVMTRSDRPRRSMTGYLLAASALSLGWAASPAWSCPETHGDKKAAKKPVKALILNDKVTAPAPAAIAVTVNGDGVVCTDAISAAKCQDAAPLAGATCTTTANDQVGVKFHTALPGTGGLTGVRSSAPLVVPLAMPSGVSVFTPAKTIGPIAPSAGPSPFAVATPMAAGTAYSPTVALLTTQSQAGPGGNDGDVDKRLERLEQQLERIAAELRETRAGQPRARGGVFGQAGGGPARPPVNIAPAPGQWRAPVATAEGPVQVKQYAVGNNSKLDALYNLMVRDDVPIRVRKDGNKIEVHGTESQQAVFKAFLDMIDPEDAGSGGGRGGSMGGGRSGGGAGATSPGGARGGEGARTRMRAPAGRAVEAEQKAKERYASALAKLNNADVQKSLRDALAARELFGQAHGHADAALIADHLRKLSDHAHAQMEHFNAEAQMFQDQAGGLQEQAQQLTEQAAEMAARAVAEIAEKSGDEARVGEKVKRDLERAARELERKARELEKQARKLERQSEELNNKRERVENDADELNGLIEELNESANVEEVAIDDMDEAIELPDLDIPEVEMPDMPEVEITVPPAAPVTPATPNENAKPAAPATPATPSAPARDATSESKPEVPVAKVVTESRP